MKNSLFWDITPCSPFRVNRRFGGEGRQHLQGRRISQGRNQHESRWQVDLCWRWRRHVPPKRRLTFNGQHGVIFQKIESFTTTALRTTNHTVVEMKMYSSVISLRVTWNHWTNFHSGRPLLPWMWDPQQSRQMRSERRYRDSTAL
jgi:hypothetical protein